MQTNIELIKKTRHEENRMQCVIWSYGIEQRISVKKIKEDII